MIGGITATPPTHARDSWHVERATSLPKIWARIAVFSGPVGAWRLTGVCRAAREGVEDHPRTLPGLVVVYSERMVTAGDVWRLDLASLQWAPLPALVTVRRDHACCAVRGSIAVIGGHTLVGNEFTATANVEALSSEKGAVFATLPPLSCGGIRCTATISVEEPDSAAGQVLLLGGGDPTDDPLSTVQLVDLATGLCTPQPQLLHAWVNSAATPV